MRAGEMRSPNDTTRRGDGWKQGEREGGEGGREGERERERERKKLTFDKERGDREEVEKRGGWS